MNTFDMKVFVVNVLSPVISRKLLVSLFLIEPLLQQVEIFFVFFLFLAGRRVVRYPGYQDFSSGLSSGDAITSHF